MLDQDLLSILVCPENRAPVQEADADLVSRLNEAIRSGTVKNRAGETVSEAIDGALVREDRAYAYPVRDEIPVMLIDEGIPLAQLS